MFNFKHKKPAPKAPLIAYEVLEWPVFVASQPYRLAMFYDGLIAPAMYVFADNYLSQMSIYKN